jgi:hypothetical protein
MNVTNGSKHPRFHRQDRHLQLRGPSALALLAGVSLSLLVVGVAIGVAEAGVPPLPYGPAQPVLNYVRSASGAIQTAAVFAFGSSVPLAIYAATATARLRQLGATTTGPTIGLAGGVLAAGALGLSSLLLWTLSRPDVGADAALVRALYFLVYLTGGPGHVVMLGLLIAGVATTSRILQLVPRAVAGAGLATAVVAGLTTFVLIWPGLSVLLPIARISALLWLTVAGAHLPHRRLDRDGQRHAILNNDEI